MSQPRLWWPHVRAALIALHIVAIVVLSLPGKYQIANKRAWATANMTSEFASWSQRLQGWGIQMSPKELRFRLYGTAVAIGDAREKIAWPFAHYGRLTGARQGWAMFTSPQKHPAEFHIDIKVQGDWQPLLRQRDPKTWRARQIRHNRVRKMVGRFSRTFYVERYTEAAHWFARAAFADFPEADAVRIRLYRYTSPGPEAVLAEAPVPGKYEHERVYSRQDLQ